jgi:hypothetical protein
MMTSSSARVAMAAAMVVAAAAPASAQSVSEILGFLMTNRAVETASVDRDTAAAEATSRTISHALLANLATLPVTTSSGGFVYRFSPELGTVERLSSSFGPFFVERAMAPGRNSASIGLTFQRWRFSSLDGRSLRDGTLVTTANQFVDEGEPFDVDRLVLNIQADVATLHGSAGVSDRMELGFAMPLILLRVDGSRTNHYRGQTFTPETASATALGLADMVIRAKYTVVQSRGAGLAAAVDARLPTGREEDLLGVGTMSWKLSAIASAERQRAAAHVNVSAGFGGLARELIAGGAVAIATSDRVTLTGEVVGRWIDDAGRITSVSAPHPRLVGVQTLRLLPDASGLTTIAAAPGVKWNVTDTWVLIANATVPLSRGGLTAAFTPFIGLDYAVQW